MSNRTETCMVRDKDSQFALGGRVLVSVVDLCVSEPGVEISVSAVGDKRLTGRLDIGECILYEDRQQNLYEVRLLQQSAIEAKFAVSELDKVDIRASAERVVPRLIVDDRLSDDQALSEEEATNLTRRLEKLESELLEGFAKTDQQRQFVSKELAYLVAATKDQNKKAWLFMAIGVFATISVALSVSAANLDSFWQLIENTLGRVYLLLPGS